MSTGFMLAISALYGGAMIAFALEGKWAWAVVALAWGTGNAILAFISK